MNPRRAGMTALAAVVFVFHASWWTSHAIDDAYITFRYAMNFAAGRGMVYNPGEPLEGLTNLGWALLLSPFSGGDMLGVAKLIGLSCGVATVGLLARWSEEAGLSDVATVVALAVLVAVPWAPSHAMFGLEIPAAMLCVTLGWSMYTRERERGGPWSALGMALGPWLRPDAALVPIVVALAGLVRPRFDRRMARAVVIIVASAVVLVALKLHWFGELLPNPFHVKTEWPPDRGVNYLRGFLTQPWPPLPLAILVASAASLVALVRRDLRGLPGLLFALWLGAVVLQSGDFMANFRLLVPVWPAAAAAVGLLADLALRRYPVRVVGGVAALVILPSAQVLSIDQLTADTFAGYTRKTSWLPDLASGFESRGSFSVAWVVVNGGADAVSFTDIGLFGYVIDGPVVDPLGLTDRVMAGREPDTKPWDYLSGRLGYLLVDTQSGAWGRYRDALADDGWRVVAACERAWVFANPARPQARPDDAELTRRLQAVRARAPREPWLHEAIARELVVAKVDPAIVEDWTRDFSPEKRCALGLDGCPAGPVACEKAFHLDVAPLVDTQLWPSVSGRATSIRSTPSKRQGGRSCKLALDDARTAWNAAAAAWSGDARAAAQRASSGIWAPPAVGDTLMRTAIGLAPPGDTLGEETRVATEAAREACRR